MNKYLIILGSFLLYKKFRKKRVINIQEYSPIQIDTIQKDDKTRDFTVKELRKLASLNKIKGYNKMKKAELLRELNLQIDYKEV